MRPLYCLLEVLRERELGDTEEVWLNFPYFFSFLSFFILRVKKKVLFLSLGFILLLKKQGERKGGHLGGVF